MCINQCVMQHQPGATCQHQETHGQNENFREKFVGILTYEMNTRKTYDTLCLLKAKGYQKVIVYAQPMHYQKQYVPLLRHRPELTMDTPDLPDLCRNLGYSLVYGKAEECDIPQTMPLLVCGAGILPTDFVQEHQIINSHPGYIPLVRGLDALKWAIWEDKPIGVTTHLLGTAVDSGEIIQRKEIILRENDTFFEAAFRVYEHEISMLVDALEHLDEKQIFAEPGNNEIHRRMPHELERELLRQFEKYKKSRQCLNDIP